MKIGQLGFPGRNFNLCRGKQEFGSKVTGLVAPPKLRLQRCWFRRFYGDRKGWKWTRLEREQDGTGMIEL